MNESAINWDEFPDIIIKDQLYQICHISKSTAQYLLQSGKFPVSIPASRHAAIKSRRKMLLPIWRIARFSPIAILPLPGGTADIIRSG